MHVPVGTLNLNLVVKVGLKTTSLGSRPGTARSSEAHREMFFSTGRLLLALFLLLATSSSSFMAEEPSADLNL